MSFAAIKQELSRRITKKQVAIPSFTIPNLNLIHEANGTYRKYALKQFSKNNSPVIHVIATATNVCFALS
jgi:hypothetical protein